VIRFTWVNWPCSQTGNGISCGLGSITDGGSVTMSMVALAMTCGHLNNTSASALSTGIDPNPFFAAAAAIAVLPMLV
jgi:hypothetical protein